MVRFKPKVSEFKSTFVKCFNSTMVRFKLSRGAVAVACMRCFNSTMVRFKRGAQGTTGSQGATFQFHDGSIQALAQMQSVGGDTLVSIPRWFDSSLLGPPAIL